MGSYSMQSFAAATTPNIRGEGGHEGGGGRGTRFNTEATESTETRCRCRRRPSAGLARVARPTPDRASLVHSRSCSTSVELRVLRVLRVERFKK
jgi:hypothetical protein